MATKLYVGINGSGKSYEVVTVVILNALRAGRRVVSNIAGLNFTAMRTMLLTQAVDLDEIGSIVIVSNEQVLQDNFFRTDNDAADFETFIKAGDLLVLDEIWRFWTNRDTSVTERQLNYFRMHRHFVHAISGLTCENVLITQLATDVPPKIRGVIEQTFKMTKLTSLGFEKRYRVDIYAGTDTQKRVDPIQSLQRKYNPRFFNFYTSHSQNKSGVKAEEQSVDKRGNILKKGLIAFGIPFSIVFICLAFWFVYRFFHPSSINGKPVNPVAAAPVAGQLPVSGVPVNHEFDSSDDYKVIGRYFLNGNTVYTLKRTSNSMLRYVLIKDPKIVGQTIEIKLPNGQTVTTYSGNADMSMTRMGGVPR